MNDLIYRQDAIDAMSCDITIKGKENAELVSETIASFFDRVKALPAVDAVPVVRCEKCVYWNDNFIPTIFTGNKRRCLLDDSFTEKDWFCKGGKEGK